MKKLVLIAGAATLVFPALAHAKGNNDGQHYTYKKVDMSKSHDNRDEYRIELQSEENFVKPRSTTQNFVTVAGEKIIIEGDTVYKVAPDGYRFFAPNGSYATKSGQNVVVRDGQLTRIETPGEVVTIN
jgi:hypothetical protein